MPPTLYPYTTFLTELLPNYKTQSIVLSKFASIFRLLLTLYIDVFWTLGVERKNNNKETYAKETSITLGFSPSTYTLYLMTLDLRHPPKPLEACLAYFPAASLPLPPFSAFPDSLLYALF